jgi:hypothetical protein
MKLIDVSSDCGIHVSISKTIFRLTLTNLRHVDVARDSDERGSMTHGAQLARLPSRCASSGPLFVCGTDGWRWGRLGSSA